MEDLYQMTSKPDERVVIRSVDWAFYEQLVDSIPEGANIHVDYDGKDVEIMSPSPLHDGVKTLLDRFVELTAEESRFPVPAWARRHGSDRRSLAAWKPTNPITSWQRSSRPWPRP